MSDINPYQSPATPADPMEGQPDADIRLYEATQTLAQTRPWVRLLSVLGFLVSGFSVAGLIGMAFMNVPGMVASTVTTIMIAIAMMTLMYFIPSLLLWRYASRISWFLNEQNPASLATAIAAQKTFWMYVGIAGTFGAVYSMVSRLMPGLGW